MRFLADHRDEGNATLPAEGEYIESWFLNEEPGGMYLYCYVICDDADRANEVFAASTAPIDHEHRRYIRQCVDYDDYVDMSPVVALGDYSVFRR